MGNRLVKVQDDSSGSPGTTVAVYRYDGLGRRIREYTPYGNNYLVTESYYNRAWQLVQTRYTYEYWSGEGEMGLGPFPYEVYVWGQRYIDAPVVRYRDTAAPNWEDGSLDEKLYYTTDANMNVTALVEPDGDVAERYVYDPYGKVTVLNPDWSTDSDGSDYDNPILYCGYYRDSETGLYHVRHRDYHVTLGRWMERDPGPEGMTSALVPATLGPISAGGFMLGNASGRDSGTSASAAQPPQFDLATYTMYFDDANLYNYCRATPPNAQDPSGLWIPPPNNWIINKICGCVCPGATPPLPPASPPVAPPLGSRKTVVGPAASCVAPAGAGPWPSVLCPLLSCRMERTYTWTILYWLRLTPPYGLGSAPGWWLSSSVTTPCR